MKIGLIAGLFGISASWACQASAEAIPLDVTRIDAVAITGEASSILLTTDSGKPYQAGIESHWKRWSSRWYSSWFFDDCESSATMRIEGTTLRIHVAPAPWLDFSDCVVEITANIPEDKVVSIDQIALQASLAGDFAGVTIVGKAADVSLDGHASDVAVGGEAVKTSLSFKRVTNNETITVDAKALDVFLAFGKDVPISYSVNAVASFVDSSIPNTPGARPVVTIKGDFVRATIR